MANLIKLPDLNNVGANSTATLKIPKYLLTLTRLVLKMGGTNFTKAHLKTIKVKLGSRVVWSLETFNAVAAGTFLDRINKYRGLYDQADTITIDWTERDFMNIVAREIGGYDLASLADDLYLEVEIGAATAPTLAVFGQFTPPQTDKPGVPSNDVIVQKLMSAPWSYAAGGRYYLNFNPRGALIKRIYFNFSGTQGAAGVDSNLWKVEIKKNGQTIFDPNESVFRFVQQEMGRVPQSNMYVMDFVHDNNASGALVTADASSFEIIMNFTGADSGVSYF